jgi:glycosyltransferase involved in cell wall biosynthesis
MLFFSVIIAAKNEASRLSGCLTSLCEQTFKDFEVILVDDGSTDRTLEVAKDFHDRLHLTILKTQGVGLGAARNLAVYQASAPYLAFLDADDHWMPRKLAVVQQHIEGAPQARWFYHQVLDAMPDGRKYLRNCWQIRNWKHFLKRGNPVVPSACVMQLKLFQEFNGFEVNPDAVEDLGLWLRILYHGELPVFISEQLTIYRVGGGVSSDVLVHLKKVFRALELVNQELDMESDLLDAFARRKYYEAGRYSQKLGQHQLARQFFRQAGWSFRLLVLWFWSWFAAMGQRRTNNMVDSKKT